MPKLNSSQKTTISAPKPDRLSREFPDIPERPSEHRAYLLGVDPGGGKDKDGEIGHVGLTLAAMDRALPNGFQVFHCWEATPEDFIPWFTLTAGLDMLDHVILERFKLQKEKALSLSGSEFEVVQLIGWIKITITQLNADPTAARGIGLTLQLPDERLGPVGKLMEKASMVHVSPKSPDHARSSEDHLMTYAFRSGLILDSSGAPIVLR